MMASKGFPRAKSDVESVPAELRAGAEVAAERGAILFEWWRASESSGRLKKFKLAEENESVQMRAFFDLLPLDGNEVPVMGCLQRHSFEARTPTAQLSEHLDRLVRKDYFERAVWLRPDGQSGGFHYRPLFGKDREGIRNLQDASAMTLDRVGPEFEWVVFQVDILDFIRSFPRVGRFAKLLSGLIKESAYILIHPKFSTPALPETAGTLTRHCFGYSFLPCAVHPSFFGFGPGRFGSAVKQFDVAALENGRVEIRLSFIVTPRSEKVLNLWGFDPVYSFSRFLDLLTLRRFNLDGRVHDRLDGQMLTHHCRVHQAFLQGLAEAFQRGAAEAPKTR